MPKIFFPPHDNYKSDPEDPCYLIPPPEHLRKRNVIPCIWDPSRRSVEEMQSDEGCLGATMQVEQPPYIWDPSRRSEQEMQCDEGFLGAPMQVKQPQMHSVTSPFKAAGPSPVFPQAGIHAHVHEAPASISPSLSAVSGPAWQYPPQGSLAARQAMMYIVDPPSYLHQAVDPSVAKSSMSDDSHSVGSDFVRRVGEVSVCKQDVPTSILIQTCQPPFGNNL
ncbi:hypothetical protein ACHAWO_014028 [Cyclotella atomus]|uniref:Uncharacterized protein n=1 Tax=Cyclotella atomus TaxID=382360 RepID=A0ABD3QEZ9_9STRA